jgi:uncharacterized protein YvpB
LTSAYLLLHTPHRTSQICHLDSFVTQCWFVALNTDQPFLLRVVEIHTSYQRHIFHTTWVNALKSWLVQVETCTDKSLLRSSHMAPFKSRIKIIHTLYRSQNQNSPQSHNITERNEVFKHVSELGNLG